MSISRYFLQEIQNKGGTVSRYGKTPGATNNAMYAGDDTTDDVLQYVRNKLDGTVDKNGINLQDRLEKKLKIDSPTTEKYRRHEGEKPRDNVEGVETAFSGRFEKEFKHA